MNRVRRTVRCAICGLEPHLVDEKWVCSCPKISWAPKKSYEGSEEDRALLKAFGWKLLTDSSGFAYWVGPGGAGVVSLYEDGTWAGGPEEFNELEEYLRWRASHGAEPLKQAPKPRRSA